MTDERHDLGSDDPEGGHDPEALKEGAERMRATKAGDASEDPREDDPEGGHDPEALEEAAERMHTSKGDE